MSFEHSPVDEGGSHKFRKIAVFGIALGLAGYVEIGVRDSQDVARWMNMDGHATEDVTTRPYKDMGILSPVDSVVSPMPIEQAQLDEDKIVAPPVTVVRTAAPVPVPKPTRQPSIAPVPTVTAEITPTPVTEEVEEEKDKTPQPDESTPSPECDDDDKKENREPRPSVQPTPSPSSTTDETVADCKTD